MSQSIRVAAGCAPSLAGGARLIRWVCTSNPFYVLSAGLFLVGLRLSFGLRAGEVETWSLMSGLAGYTLLLAVTACLLVRFGNVWDDVRTVLLLVVLMFLATSVTFDEVLVLDPALGRRLYLGGLLFAVLVAEGLLRGIRLRLPVLFRVPCYLILALFFLYPLALSPLTPWPESEVLLWGLFGFSPAAGLVFLTLLPAIRRGPRYVANNGSPWRWPLYPWVLFGMLGLAVPARAYLLCWSLHLLGRGSGGELVFGLYFLVPFGLAATLLLLEIGIVSGRRGVLWAALAAPAGLAVLATTGHRPDPVYQKFLEVFASRLGGDPLFLTLAASAGFYGYAVLRRVALAGEGLSLSLVALAFAGGDTPWLLPILLATLLQLGVGIRHGQGWRCLLGAGGLVALLVLGLPEEMESSLRPVIAFHLTVIAMVIVGAVFDDLLARVLRGVSAVLILAASLVVLLTGGGQNTRLPGWAVEVYPLAMAGLLVAHGLLPGHRLSLAASALVLASWLTTVGLRGYAWLRQAVVGLDYLALSLVLFALAVLVSLAKAGVLSRAHAPGREPSLPDGG